MHSNTKNIPFITIFPPSAAHAFNDTRYQGSSAIVPDFLLSKFFPPSAAHAFNYNNPFIKIHSFYHNFPPPLCSPCFQLHSFYQKQSRVTIVANDLHLPHKKEVGSQATLGSRSRKKCSEASKNIAPATQSERIGSRRTARRQGRNLPQNGTSVTGNFSQCHGDLLGGV